MRRARSARNAEIRSSGRPLGTTVSSHSTSTSLFFARTQRNGHHDTSHGTPTFSTQFSLTSTQHSPHRQRTSHFTTLGHTSRNHPFSSTNPDRFFSCLGSAGERVRNVPRPRPPLRDITNRHTLHAQTEHPTRAHQRPPTHLVSEENFHLFARTSQCRGESKTSLRTQSHISTALRGSPTPDT